MINNLFFKQRWQTLAIYTFSNVKLCFFALLLTTLNEESLGFDLLVGQKKQSEDVTLGNYVKSVSPINIL